MVSLMEFMEVNKRFELGDNLFTSQDGVYIKLDCQDGCSRCEDCNGRDLKRCECPDFVSIESGDAWSKFKYFEMHDKVFGTDWINDYADDWKADVEIALSENQDGDEWHFEVLDTNGNYIKDGWTRMVNLELFDDIEADEYIKKYCL